MKLAALNSLKFKKLKRRLSLAHWQTVGLLESLWLFTQGNAIAGDIGKYSDEDIAAAIEWQGDPVELIETLVECRLLDRCAEHRLIVHDWEEHAPRYVKGAMESHKKQFAKQTAKQPAEQNGKHGSEQDTKTPTTLPSLTLPNQALPKTASADAEPLPPELGSPKFAASWESWIKYRRERTGKKFPESTRRMQLKRLAAMGEDRAIACIEHTISQGWTGLYEPKGTGQNPSLSSQFNESMATFLAEGEK